MLTGKNKRKVGKRVLCLIFAFLLSINSFAAVVSDNDGAAFVTKAEFEALKDNFAEQIDSYNTSIDSKIDGAIASYLSGIKMRKKTKLKNYYSSYGNGSVWRWGNNKVTRSEYPYGGCWFWMYATDTLSQKATTMHIYGQDDWTNTIFKGDKSLALIELKVYNYQIYYVDFAEHHYYQNASKQNGSRSWYTWQRPSVTLTRTGQPQTTVSINTGSLPSEEHYWNAYIVENWKDATSKGTLSINAAGNEYFISQDGDGDKSVTWVEAKSTTSGSSGSFGIDAQQYGWKWRPNWEKHAVHQNLRIKNWEDITGKIEQVKSGAPISFIENSEAEITIKYKVDKAGKLYVYSDVEAKPYSSLVDGDTVKIVDVTELNVEKTVKLTECNKDTWIRIMFLPNSTSSYATLTITDIECES